ncbi:hypothetical protein Bca4012_032802 [Brassica carinata]
METEILRSTEISETLFFPATNHDEDVIPHWKDQITTRGLIASALLGILFSIITHKLNLTVGIIPSLNVAAGLLGFFFVKSWTGLLSKLGFSVKPFTKQENTVIQTCVVACYGLAYSGKLRLISPFTPKLPTFIGCGLICPHLVNCSVLLGAIISWGFLWPFISRHAGDWYPSDLETNDFKGLYGYKFLDSDESGKRSESLLEKKKRDEVFLKDQIPLGFAVSGYACLAAISTATIPLIFPPLKWYFVLCSYLVAPGLAFCNSYGAGLTDMSLPSTYGKIGLFTIASIVGNNSGGGGVIASLSACGVMMAIVSTAADLMQDFKTGYLTLSSAKSMFVTQLLGTAMGCVIAPLTFWMFWTAFEVGDPDGLYKAPYAVIYREMAILGIEGFAKLPKHCLALCCGFFVAALVVNLVRDITPPKISKFTPLPMAMAAPFYIGAYFAIDMFVGTVVLFIWERVDKKDADDYSGAVASGLICGDGIWTIPSAILSILRINPPICMYFRPS